MFPSYNAAFALALLLIIVIENGELRSPPTLELEEIVQAVKEIEKAVDNQQKWVPGVHPSMQQGTHHAEQIQANGLSGILYLLPSTGSQQLLSTLQHSVLSMQNRMNDYEAALSSIQNSLQVMNETFKTLKYEAQGYTCNAKGQCAKYYETNVTWAHARRSCERKGTRLPIILDWEYDTFISSLIPEKMHSWIGLKQYGRNEYRWVDGTELGSYTSWEDDEDADRDEYDDDNCMGTRSSSTTWWDWGCDEKGPYICEVTD